MITLRGEFTTGERLVFELTQSSFLSLVRVHIRVFSPEKMVLSSRVFELLTADDTRELFAMMQAYDLETYCAFDDANSRHQQMLAQYRLLASGAPLDWALAFTA